MLRYDRADTTVSPTRFVPPHHCDNFKVDLLHRDVKKTTCINEGSMYSRGCWCFLSQVPCFSFRILAILFTLFACVNGCGSGPSPVSIQRASASPTSAFTPAAGPLVVIPSSSLSLSGEWRFTIDAHTSGQARGWAEPDFDDSRWTVVTVPHTWNVMSDDYNYDGIGWYRLRFMLPAIASHGHLRLRFEAVFHVADVWLNSIYLGEHEGGYTPFEFDVSGLAKPGVEHILAVQVDNLRATNRLPATLDPGSSLDWWTMEVLSAMSLFASPVVPSLPISRLSPCPILLRWARLIRRQSPLE